MAGVATDESGAGRSFEGLSSGQQTNQQCQSGEALAEWRSLEQVENGSPSTSPPYWDSDDDDDDGGPKPSDLYGKYTWKIDKFSQINKRELRSNAFEVGGYKWYILIYPQGCDVCNHLSLFLCVANHDKLLPGWSHFAQFTIAVVNKDPKKSKYSDTLHRFWKKEHDWGWKKFMELSKVLDGFIDADTLIIKAQVQVIRERADRPFRCLDCQYRRELVRVYLTNVEQICRRFVEERRGKLGKLIEDKAKWSSFCAFWLDMNESSRLRMRREKTESILKVIVKHFFIEKEVTSTLVMDSLYSGLKALEGQTIDMKGKSKCLEGEDLPVPIVHVEKDMFVLVDDVLRLLEKAVIEPLPPKDEKGPQNRTKDGTAGEEFNKDSIERDERRLTELGRRTIEIFVLAHIFGKIEVSYQEAVSLKKQEELIREEEEAWLAVTEQKARRGAVDKEKKSKKKQGKQKRNNRKGKDKGRDDRASSAVEEDKIEQEDSPTAERTDLPTLPEVVFEKSEAVEDVSDVSDSVDCVPETLPPDSEDTDSSEVFPPVEASSCGLSGVQNRVEHRSASVVDDSSSTCSSDSVLSAVISVPPPKGSSRYNKSQKSQSRAKNYQRKLTPDAVDWVNEERSQSSEAGADARHPSGASQSSKTIRSLSHTAVKSLQDRVVVNGTEQQVGKKEEETNSFHRGPSTKNSVAVSADRAAPLTSPPKSPSKPIPLIASLKLDSDINSSAIDPVMVKKQSSDSSPKIMVVSANSAENAAISRPDPLKVATSKPAEIKFPAHAVMDNKPAIPPPMSRPLSAPVVPGPRPAVSVVSMVQTAPVLSRSVSAVGRLGPEPSTAYAASPSYVPQSYRNAIIGNSSPYSSQNHSSTSYSQASAPLFPQNVSDRTEPNPINPGISFGMVNHHHHHQQQQQQHDNMLQNGPLWMRNGNLLGDHGSVPNDMQSFDLYRPAESRSMDQLPSEIEAGTSGRQSVSIDDFPHLDIINDLLDDGIENSHSYHSFRNGPQNLNRQFSFPTDPGMSSYHRDDGFQHSYGSTARTYDAPRDMISQASQRPYMNGQIDGFTPNQWQNMGSDLPFFNVRNMDNEGYHYRTPEYNPNINGYTVFRPPNGH